MLGTFLEQIIMPAKRIFRWSGMPQIEKCNDAEHMWGVAVIADNLAYIEKEHFGKEVDLGRLLENAIYHDCIEIITNDMRSKVKRKSLKYHEEHRKLEKLCFEQDIRPILPLRNAKQIERAYLNPKESGTTIEGRILEAADIIHALIEAITEVKMGNTYFVPYLQQLGSDLLHTNTDSARYFIKYSLLDFGLGGEMYGKEVSTFITHGSVEGSVSNE